MYDDLAAYYHLIFADWDASIERQGEQLAAVIHARWPGARRVLDVSCGIGTQAIALAKRGFSVVASDASQGAIARARREASARGVAIEFSPGDMRRAHEQHGSGFDCVVSADNSVPHLLTDAEILLAFEQMRACLRPGGGLLVSVRDYASEERGKNIVKPYGARVENGKRFLPFQVWDFDGDRYDFTFFIVEEDLASGAVKTHALRSRYYAITTDALMELMRKAGFADVERQDGAFYQPLLVGTRGG